MLQPEHNISLAEFTSYKIGGIARDVYFPHNAGEFMAVLQELKQRNTPFFILGGGSNVLVGDGFWDGAVIVTTKMDAIEIHDDHLVAGAGLGSSRIAETARDHGMTGLEFLYKLPGSIGGAVAGNARFADVNVSDVITHITAARYPDGLKTFDAATLDFAYKKNPVTADGWYICDVGLSWKKGNRTEIEGRMKEIDDFRHDRHHFIHPSCGCVFKNDHSRNIQVGRLLDSLGLKGTRVGDAEVAGFHANFIVNTGNATAHDILSLIERIEGIVRDTRQIELEREVKLYGTFV